MRGLRRIVALVLLALWVPVTQHCALECLPGLHWFQCCCADESDSQTPSNCEGQPCGSLEAGAVKLEERVVSVPPPATWVMSDLPPAAEPLPAAVVEAHAVGAALPGLARIWQFSCRAARLPRAPSFIS